MAAYCVFDILEISDQEKMEAYRSRVQQTIAQYGGEYLVRGGKFDVVEGDWRPGRLVILVFPSLEEAHRWYDSEEYQAILPLRTTASRANGVFVEGL